MRRPSRSACARLFLAAALAVTALTGCRADPGPAPPADTAPDVTRYVAIGDSYTAAPLFPLDDDLIIDSCLRSPSNYPTLVAEALDVEVVDVSCSGASTTSMFSKQNFTSHSRPPQLDALTPDTDLVTLGIGANDFRYFSRMIFTCLSVARDDIEGSPCRERNTTDAGLDRLERKVDKIRVNVGRVVEAIAERAPEARIMLVGYPQILPAAGTCRPRLPLATGDYIYTLELNLRLADAVREGGVEAGAEYVDLVAASQGHDICAEEPWVAGIRGRARNAAGLHPFPAEQEAVAELVLGLL